MRGAPVPADPERALPGIIPADAGSTPCSPRGMTKCKDHPRRCGEHLYHYLDTLRKGGSSPQMRGALRPSVMVAITCRIIPADAGSTH